MKGQDPKPTTSVEPADFGERLFRWRSYPPVAVLAAILIVTFQRPVPLGGASWGGAWTGCGLVLGALGLGARAWAIGFVPEGTSGRGTRAMRADTLNTTGLYSVVRHPLYLGNLLLWLGVATSSGRPEALLLAAAVFWPYYRLIMRAEDHFLKESFGGEFDEWAERTPTLLPTFARWATPTRDFDLGFVLGRDHHALYGFVVATWLLVLVRSHFAWGDIGLGWWLYLAAGTLVFVSLWLLQRYTTMLQSSDG